jgi:hypothetical protein
MNKYLIFISMVLILAGCGDDDGPKIKSAIKAKLRDPSSAQFKDMVLSKNKIYACITFNAKNGAGAYASWSIAELRKKDLQWEVTNLDAKAANCTLDKLNERTSPK